jgi:hypothetical protein
LLIGATTCSESVGDLKAYATIVVIIWGR